MNVEDTTNEGRVYKNLIPVVLQDTKGWTYSNHAIPRWEKRQAMISASREA